MKNSEQKFDTEATFLLILSFESTVGLIYNNVKNLFKTANSF